MGSLATPQAQFDAIWQNPVLQQAMTARTPESQIQRDVEGCRFLLERVLDEYPDDCLETPGARPARREARLPDFFARVPSTIAELMPETPFRNEVIRSIEHVRVLLVTRHDPVCRRLPAIYTGERGLAPTLPYAPQQAIFKENAKRAFRTQNYQQGAEWINRILTQNSDLVFDVGTMGEALFGANHCQRRPETLLLAEHCLQLEDSVARHHMILHAAFHLKLWGTVLHAVPQLFNHPDADEPHKGVALYFGMVAACHLHSWDSFLNFLKMSLDRGDFVSHTDQALARNYMRVIEEAFLTMDVPEIDRLIRVLQRSEHFRLFLAHAARSSNGLPPDKIVYREKVFSYLHLRDTIGWPSPSF